MLTFIIIGLMIFAVYIACSKNAAPRVPDEEKSAVIVTKRMLISGGERASTIYYSTFELGDGSRRELPVSGEVYGRIAEGDRGVLRLGGGRFVSFGRNESRYSLEDPNKAVHKCPACGATYRGVRCEYCDTLWVEEQ